MANHPAHSQLVQSQIQEAGSIVINQMVYDKKRANEDVTVLSLGEAFFKIPQLKVGDSLFEKGYHYCESQGLPSLREKIGEYYKNNFEVSCNPDTNVLITSGSKAAIYMALRATINPGEEVILWDPFWLSYNEQIILAHGVPKPMPYDADLMKIESFITDKTKLIILNNPNNPSGQIITKEEIEHVYSVCQKHGCFLLIDEAYSDFCLDGDFYSGGRLSDDLEGLIICNSLSKNFGLSGWRVGYILASESTVRQVLKLNQHINTCAPTLLQIYIDEHFETLQEITTPQVQDVLKRRTKVKSIIDELELKVMPGNATFYFMLDISKSKKKSMDFAQDLLSKYNIAVVPGIHYGPSVDNFVRIGVGTETTERIRNALKTIKSLLNSKKRPNSPNTEKEFPL